MLMVIKYLTAEDVVKLLDQYERKTGMHLWYND